MIKLDALGTVGLSVVADREPVEPVILQPKRLALFCYLMLARPRGFHRRDSLLVLFWPDSTEKRARNALNQAVHALRASLGRSVIISRGREEVGVAADRTRCDVLAFDEAFDAHRYDEALELYCGELLKGFHATNAPGFERWLDRERSRRRRQAKTAATELAERKRRMGNRVGAIRCLDRALEIAPSDEAVLRRLMNLLDEEGDRAGARRAYDRFAEDLESRLGTRPSPETWDLVSQIMVRDAAHPSIEDPIPAADAPKKPGVSSLAVLPLEDLHGDPQQAYFVDGLTEALIGELARIDGLRVISRQSVLRFRDSDRPLSDIGDMLGVDAVIEGSMLRVGEQVRLSLQLVRVDPEEHLWAETYERELADILGLHRDVARVVSECVAGVLATKNGFRADEHADGVQRVHPGAYDAFLQGIAHLTRQRAEDFLPAIRHFREAVELDPEFGEPNAWIAVGWANMVAGGAVSPDDALRPMREAVDRALELDDELSPAHLARALVLQIFTRDWREALEAYTRAAKVSGGTVHAPWKDWLAMFLVGQGRFDEGLSLAHDELRRDPIGPTAWLVGWTLHKARRFEASVDRLEWTRQTWPDYPFTLPFLAASHLFAGQYDAAVEISRQAVDATPALQLVLAYSAATLGRAGKSEDAVELTGRLESMGPDAYVDPFNLAVAYAGLGENDRALDELQRLVVEGSPQSWILAPEPFFDPLRGDPRFDTVLAQLDLPRLEF